MWILLVMAILVAICLLPLGVVVRYDQSGFAFYLKVAMVRFQLFADRMKKRKRKGKKSVKSEKGQAEKLGGKLKDFLPLARTALTFLNKLRQRITVNNLQMKLVLAGDDPCDLSILYGRTLAAVSGLQPQLNRFFRIKRQNIDVQCDYLAEETTVYFYLDATISLIMLLWLLVRYGTKFFKQYFELKNQRKGGTDYESETPSNA